MGVTEILAELDQELEKIRDGKAVIKTAQRLRIQKLKEYLDLNMIDLQDFLDVRDYLKVMEITKPKDKTNSEQLKL